MNGQLTSQSITLHNNLQLTVKPLNSWNLSKFKPHIIQEHEFDETKFVFRHGFPEHQAMFYSGKKSILACGLIDIKDGQYYLWSLFGENFKNVHFKFVIKYLNNYLNILPYSSIHHIIRKDIPTSIKMLKALGFRYVREEQQDTEHWVRIK